MPRDLELEFDGPGRQVKLREYVFSKTGGKVTVERRQDDRVLAAGKLSLPPKAERSWTEWGAELWKCLPDNVQSELRKVVHAKVRLLLHHKGWPEAFEACWETLGHPYLIANGTWQVVRLSGPPSGDTLAGRDGPALRVLLLVGSQRQPSGVTQAEGAVLSTTRALRKLVRNHELTLEIAATTASLDPDGESVRVDHVLTQRDQVVDLLTKNRYHAIHFIGHSDADKKNPFAKALLFEFPGGDEQIDVQDIIDAFRKSPPVLFSFHACATRQSFVGHVLEVIDHVVGMHDFIDPTAAGVFAQAFYEKLSETRRVGPAMEAGRAALYRRADLDDQAWMPAHWARTEHDVVFDPLGIAVARYCARLAEREQRLTLRFGRRPKLLLDHVHVKLAVAPREAEGARATDARSHEVPGAWEQRAVAFDELVAELPQRWLVFGTPGAGKTTTMRHHAFALATSTRRSHVPVYLSLPRWLRDELRPANKGAAGLCQYLEDDWDVHTLSDALQACANDGKLALLLDGWDELGETERRAARQLIDNLVSAWPRVPVIVAARTTSEVPLSGFARADVQPLEPSQQRELLEKVFRTALSEAAEVKVRVAAAEEVIVGARSTQELARNPLLLTLLAELILSGKLLPRPPAPASALRKHKLFEEILERFFERDFADQTEPDEVAKIPETERVRDLLRWLAWEMTLQPSAFCDSWSMLEELLKKTELADTVRRAAGYRTCRKLFDAIAERTGLFVPEDESDDTRWSFLHRNLQEALCAEHWWHVVLKDDPEPTKAVLAHLQSALRREDGGWRVDGLDFWTEPTALLAPRLRNGDALLVPLLQDYSLRKVGLRVMEALDQIKPVTIEHVLVELQHYWAAEIRVQAYAALPGRVAPEHLDDVAQVLTARAARSDVAVAEVGALVECLTALGAGRVVDQVLDRYPRLSAADVREWFTEVPGRPGTPLWCRVPKAGGALEFQMGSPPSEQGRKENEGPVRVTLSQPFWISATTITLGQYRMFRKGHQHRWGDDPRLPVTGVSWFEAALFCHWLNRQRRRDPDIWRPLFGGLSDGSLLRLPTEAQWEFAARGGTETRFWSGDAVGDLSRVGWFEGNSDGQVHPVAEKPANPFDLFDMHGNVWEWCQDWYAVQLAGGLDPTGPASAERRVLRGGSCWSVDRDCRSAGRFGADVYSGFRVVALAAPRR